MLFPVDLLSPATEGMMVTQTTLAYKAALRNDNDWIMSLTEVFHTHTQSHTHGGNTNLLCPHFTPFSFLLIDN